MADAKQRLVDVLKSALIKHGNQSHFKTLLEHGPFVDITEIQSGVYGDAFGKDVKAIELSQENIDDLYRSASRLLSVEIANEYWRRRASYDPASLRTAAKLEVIALATDKQTREELETAASEGLQELNAQFGHEVTKLDAKQQDAYLDVWRQGDVVRSPLDLPKSVDVRKADRRWPKHVHSDGSGFPFDGTSWETTILREELSRLDVVGWLRNPDRKNWALAVPYESNGQLRPFFPDFLVFRAVSGAVAVDLLDPHNDALSDWWEKARGLARFAERYWPRFGRIELAIVRNDSSFRLDLTNEATRQRVLAATSNDHLRSLFRLP